MPGMLARAPERTLSSSGSWGSPKCLPVSSPGSRAPSSTALSGPSGYVQLPVRGCNLGSDLSRAAPAGRCWSSRPDWLPCPPSNALSPCCLAELVRRAFRKRTSQSLLLHNHLLITPLAYPGGGAGFGAGVVAGQAIRLAPPMNTTTPTDMRPGYRSRRSKSPMARSSFVMAASCASRLARTAGSSSMTSTSSK